VYLGTAPGGCSGDLATGALVLPVLAASVYRDWLSKGVNLIDADPGTVEVNYTDSSEGIYEYRYGIDTAANRVNRLEKFDRSYGFLHRIFCGTFLYSEGAGDLPVLRAIALNDDTTLNKGGYRFLDVKIDEPLEDSLFIPNSAVRMPAAVLTGRATGRAGAPATIVDLLGRAGMPRIFTFSTTATSVMIPEGGRTVLRSRH